MSIFYSNIPPPQFHPTSQLSHTSPSNSSNDGQSPTPTPTETQQDIVSPSSIPRSLPAAFSRRVSFNNIHPEYLNECPSNTYVQSVGASNITASLLSQNPGTTSIINNNTNSITNNNNNTVTVSSTLNNTNNDFGYGSTIYNNDLAKTYSHYVPVKKKLKLPDPPSKSILKNKVSSQQMEFTISGETINYHDIDEDLANNHFDTLDFTDDNISTTTNEPPKNRRKSYSEMTYEELMALDPQFKNTKSKTNVDQFKFDSQKTYYLPSTKRSSISSGGLGGANAKNGGYPSSNENNYKSINITVKHNEFDSISFGRTLLTVISGRKHTWNSIDWLFLINEFESQSHTFLNDGDYIIISSLISQKFLKEYNPKNYKKKSIDEYLYSKGENLINYLINRLYLKFNDLKLKITVEFVMEDFYDTDPSQQSLINTPNTNNSLGNKFMINHLFKQYHPNLFIIGNKSSNLNFKYPIKIKKQNEKDEYLIKLASYVVKYSTIPVILIGSNNRYHYVHPHSHEDHVHHTPGLKFVDSLPSPTLNKSFSNSIPVIPSISLTQHDSNTTKKKKFRTDSTSSSIESIESFYGGEGGNGNGNGSSAGNNPIALTSTSGSKYSSKSDIGLEQSESHQAFEDKFIDLNESSDYDDPLKFKNLISLISDQSLSDCKSYLKALNSKDDSLKINTKIHSIYRSQSLGGTSSSFGGGSNGSFLDNSSSGGRAASIYSIGSNGSKDDYTFGTNQIYKVKSLISYDDDEKDKKEMKKKRSTSSIGPGADYLSTVKNLKNKAQEKENAISPNSSDSDINSKKKKSIWKKMGFKK
ncbi:hypothetical protein DFJ63DRAFT_319371 [Scheffersomyces coipomensis]|uniref:uncharacterized protein n=1 Tax=Scheffersomyces coipomensis TaxID=1788519 RepID=UPI00315CDF4B